MLLSLNAFPLDPLRGILEDDAARLQFVADGVGAGKVLGLAGGGALGYQRLDLGVKVGGVNINMNGTVQNVTINGQTYKVQFRTLNYAQTGMTPKSAYTDYYYLTITKA